MRYPQDVFKIQRAILSRYHVTDATTFYNGTDVWIVPNDPTVSRRRRSSSRRTT